MSDKQIQSLKEDLKLAKYEARAWKKKAETTIIEERKKCHKLMHDYENLENKYIELQEKNNS